MKRLPISEEVLALIQEKQEAIQERSKNPEKYIKQHPKEGHIDRTPQQVKERDAARKIAQDKKRKVDENKEKFLQPSEKYAALDRFKRFTPNHS